LTTTKPAVSGGGVRGPDVNGCAVNLRDLGGLRTVDGRRTRPGVLYRSDALYVGDAAPAFLTTWPPAVVIDLRSPGEHHGESPWDDRSRVHQLPMMRQAAIVTEALARRAREEAGSDGDYFLRWVYEHIVDDVPDQLAGLVGIAASAGGPVLVHCAAGKDRTGIAIATLLLAAGVAHEEIVADYTATAENMPALLTRLAGLGRGYPDLRPSDPRLRAPAELIELVIERLDGGPGGVTAWLTRHGASESDVAAWRERFLGD
jgi:protein-tyrosine phosphatase